MTLDVQSRQNLIEHRMARIFTVKINDVGTIKILLNTKQNMKRFFDLCLTIPAYVFLSPLLILIGCIIFFSMGTPVFFRQKRPGYKGKPFEIYKFRTMTDRCDPNGCLLPDSERLTRFGRFLRSTSLDELPELMISLFRTKQYAG